MYKMYLLDSLLQSRATKIYDDVWDANPILTDPELELNGDNGILVGKLTFKLLSDASIEELKLLKSIIIVTETIQNVETVIFRGRPLIRDDDSYNDKDFTFEGILASLNDTTQVPSTETGLTFAGYFRTLIIYHDLLSGVSISPSKLTDSDDCYLSQVRSKEPIDEAYFEFIRSRASTMDHIKNQFIEPYGGYLYIEDEPFVIDENGIVQLENNLRYVDIYDSEHRHINSQRVEFGKNLVSIKRSASAEDFATVYVPLGAPLTDVEKSWPYYRSTGEGGGWKIRKITNSPDNYELIDYSSSGAYIDSETGKEKTVGNQNYKMPPDVNVLPGEVYFLTTYLEGFSTETSAAAYAILSRDGQTLYSVGPSVRNSTDQNGNVEVKKLALADERIEIPEDTLGTGLKLRLSRFASVNDPNPAFILKKFNKNYMEQNVTIMSAEEHTDTSIRKYGRYDFGRDAYPDATDGLRLPEVYEQSKRIYNYDLYWEFGAIEKVIEYDYASDNIENLSRRAASDLNSIGEKLEMEVQAVDLSYIDDSQEKFRVFDLVPVISPPHNLNMLLPIVSITLPLTDPASATYTLKNEVVIPNGSKKYVSQMVNSSNGKAAETRYVYIGGGSSGGGGGSGDAENAVLYVMQDLLESQKAQARANIGAVAAVAGKGLSSNDYTTAEKNKLAGIAAGAEPNVQPDWNQTDTSADDYIKNKPTISDSGVMSVNGYSGPTVNLVTSDLTNDSGYITLNDVPQEVPEADASTNGMVLGVDNGRYTFVRMTGGISDVYMDGASIVQSGTTTAVIPNANTTRFGVVKLYDGSDSTSTSLVPTANALRGVAQRVGNLETRSANWRTETQIKALIADAILDYQNELATLDRYANVVVAQSRDDVINLLFVPSACIVFNSNPYKYGYVIYNTKTISGGGSSSDIYEFPRGYIICVYRGDGYEVTISGVTYYFQYVFLKYPTLEPLAAYNEEDVEFYSGTIVSGTTLEQAQQDAEDFIAYLESQP